MAMQAANSAAALPRAQIVCHAFVEQYYSILHDNPDLVHKFYQDSSVLSRPDSDGMMTPITTMQAINDKIQSLDSKNYTAEIETADAQESHQGGCIVLVTGCLTGSDNIRKRFTQTFFLAPQEGGYFVLNDIFRYIGESGKLDTTSTSVNNISDNASSAPLMANPEPILAPDNHVSKTSPAIVSVDLENGTEVYVKSENEEGSGHEEEVINESKVQSTHHAEPTAVVSSDTSAAQEEKKSYASIVKVTKTANAHNPTSNMRWAPTNSAQPAPVSLAKPAPETEASAPSSDNPPEINNSTEEEVEGHSIYIRNLPLNAADEQLEEVFRKFGAIKRGGVQVRSNKQQGFCFGFVEFESLVSMQNAIKESPISIGGRNAVVEEKRTTTRVGSSGRGGGRYLSGRGIGGYRNDNFRGRGGDYGGRGGYGRNNNNDYRNQSEFPSRPKGAPLTGRSSNGEGGGYRRVFDQNGGGRFGRQNGGMNKAAA